MPTHHELFILRHGETEWNVADRMQGQLDSPLTPRGRMQARDQGTILTRVAKSVTALRVSPSGRAQTTAELALGARISEAVSDPRLLEVGLGSWQGRTADSIKATAKGLDLSDRNLWKFTAPGGETLEQMVARCDAVLADLTGPTVLVTHGLTSRVLRCRALGVPVTELSALPGGQGIVHHLVGGQASVLTV